MGVSSVRNDPCSEIMDRHRTILRNRSAFGTTDTELKTPAALVIIGLSN